MGRSTTQIGGVLLTLLLSAYSAFGQSEPRMVITITVDQMRAEYLYRFAPHFTGGFTRLLENGLVYRNAHYTHVPTYTAPGHATIFTGAQPRDHGIIGNDWYDPIDGTSHYCVEDTSQSVLGLDIDAAYGKISPMNLRTTTITDELHLASAGRSYIAAISIKDRGAVLPGGHRADEVYWLGGSGRFVSSTYYADSLPPWVNYFNDQHTPLSEYAQVWNPLLPIDQYRAAYPDKSEYESTQNAQSTLPRDIPSTMDEESLGYFKTSPDGNRYLTDFALELIEHIPAEELADEFTDFLSISYSSTDYVGHAFGPRSVEVMDTYLRLDQELARLFAALDGLFGEGNYIVVLTADHGVAENPNFQREELNMQARNHSGADMNVMMRSVSEEVLGFDCIRAFFNDAIYFNDSTLKANGVSKIEAEALLSEALSEQPEIKMAWPYSTLHLSQLRSAQLRSNIADERHADLYIEWQDGNYIYGKKGASHGSGYTYDTHVPCIVMGPGVPNGNIYRKTAVVDIAPTLSMMLGIALPHSAFGEPLYECLLFVEEN